MIFLFSLCHRLMTTITLGNELIAIVDMFIINFFNHFLFASFALLYFIRLFFTFEWAEIKMLLNFGVRNLFLASVNMIVTFDQQTLQQGIKDWWY